MKFILKINMRKLIPAVNKKKEYGIWSEKMSRPILSMAMGFKYINICFGTFQTNNGVIILFGIKHRANDFSLEVTRYV